MDLSVCYLASFNKELGYSIKALEHFLASYRKHNAGLKHDFVILVKESEEKILLKKAYRLAKAHNARIIEVPADGFDLGTYIRACKVLTSEYVMFLVASTQIVADNWLAKFASAFENNPNLQLAGPMGSWGYAVKVKRYPNYHIRTTHFMLKREMYLEYASTVKFPVTKEDTWEMENGDNSLSKFILKKGFDIGVVDIDGNLIMPEDWAYSKTFKNPLGQKYLLSDKHLKEYENANVDLKRYLEKCSWGQSLASTKTKMFVYMDRIMPVFRSDVYQPILLGASDNPNFAVIIKDDIGENISKKASALGKFTAFYWVLKHYLDNIDMEYFGFCRYDSFLDFSVHSFADVPFKPLMITDFEKIFNDYSDERIYEEVKNYDVVTSSAVQNIQDLKYKTELYEIIRKKTPEMNEILSVIEKSGSVLSDLAFVMKKELVKEYLNWSLEIIFELEKSLGGKSLENNTIESLSSILLESWIKFKNLSQKVTTSVSVPMDGI